MSDDPPRSPAVAVAVVVLLVAVVVAVVVGVVAAHPSTEVHRGSERRSAPDQAVYCSLASRTGATELLEDLQDAELDARARSTYLAFALEIANSAPHAVREPARAVEVGASTVSPGTPPSPALREAAATVDRYTADACD